LAEIDVFYLSYIINESRTSRKLDILRALRGKIPVMTARSGGAIPTVEKDDVGVATLKCFARGELVHGLAVHVVTNGDGDFFHRVEYIEFGECDFG
jgi:hypothetical protein